MQLLKYNTKLLKSLAELPMDWRGGLQEALITKAPQNGVIDNRWQSRSIYKTFLTMLDASKSSVYAQKTQLGIWQIFSDKNWESFDERGINSNTWCFHSFSELFYLFSNISINTSHKIYAHIVSSSATPSRWTSSPSMYSTIFHTLPDPLRLLIPLPTGRT